MMLNLKRQAPRMLISLCLSKGYVRTRTTYCLPKHDLEYDSYQHHHQGHDSIVKPRRYATVYLNPYRLLSSGSNGPHRIW